MKLACALGVSFLLLPLAAAAQSYPGMEVTANMGAIGSGYLLYPGGKYGRHVGALRQPGEHPGIVRLIKPGTRPIVRRAPRPAAPTTVAVATPPPARPVAAPTPQPEHTADISALPEDSAARLVAPSAGFAPAAPHKPTPPKPAPAKPAPAKPAPAPASAAPAMPFTFGGDAPPPAAAPPTRTASIPPAPTRTPPAATVATGLRRQSVIPFAVGASSPATADVTAVHALAASLNAALNAGATRVQLEAYGGPRGDKSSDSRRLSLKRALVIRELLIEDGVPSEKIDVRAMGGADDSGAADRVDVFLRS